MTNQPNPITTDQLTQRTFDEVEALARMQATKEFLTAAELAMTDAANAFISGGNKELAADCERVKQINRLTMLRLDGLFRTLGEVAP